MLNEYARLRMHENLLVFQKAYSLTLWLFPIINRIPKSHRLILGKELEERLIMIVIAVIEANKERGLNRIAIQKRISDELDVVRILFRLGKDMQFVSIKQYSIGVEKINEIGRMLSAWRDSS